MKVLLQTRFALAGSSRRVLFHCDKQSHRINHTASCRVMGCGSKDRYDHCMFPAWSTTDSTLRMEYVLHCSPVHKPLNQLRLRLPLFASRCITSHLVSEATEVMPEMRYCLAW